MSETAAEYARKRLGRIGHPYMLRPQWTVTDLAMFGILLSEHEDMRIRLADAQIDADDGPCQCDECVEARNRRI